jgi:hypothetical protein
MINKAASVHNKLKKFPSYFCPLPVFPPKIQSHISLCAVYAQLVTYFFVTLCQLFHIYQDIARNVLHHSRWHPDSGLQLIVLVSHPLSSSCHRQPQTQTAHQPTSPPAHQPTSQLTMRSAGSSKGSGINASLVVNLAVSIACLFIGYLIGATSQHPQCPTIDPSPKASSLRRHIAHSAIKDIDLLVSQHPELPPPPPPPAFGGGGGGFPKLLCHLESDPDPHPPSPGDPGTPASGSGPRAARLHNRRMKSRGELAVYMNDLGLIGEGYGI